MPGQKHGLGCNNLCGPVGFQSIFYEQNISCTKIGKNLEITTLKMNPDAKFRS